MSTWREEPNRAPWIAALTDTRTIQAALQIIMHAIVENRIDEDDGGYLLRQVRTGMCTRKPIFGGLSKIKMSSSNLLNV